MAKVDTQATPAELVAASVAVVIDSPVEHDGRALQPGDQASLPAEAAATLVACGAAHAANAEG